MTFHSFSSLNLQTKFHGHIFDSLIDSLTPPPLLNMVRRVHLLRTINISKSQIIVLGKKSQKGEQCAVMPAPWLQELLNTKKSLCVSFSTICYLSFVSLKSFQLISYHVVELLANPQHFLIYSLFSVYFPYFHSAQGYMFTVSQLCYCTSNSSKYGEKKNEMAQQQHLRAAESNSCL